MYKSSEDRKEYHRKYYHRVMKKKLADSKITGGKINDIDTPKVYYYNKEKQNQL